MQCRYSAHSATAFFRSPNSSLGSIWILTPTISAGYSSSWERRLASIRREAGATKIPHTQGRLTLRGAEFHTHLRRITITGFGASWQRVRDREFGAFTEIENSARVERIQRFYREREIGKGRENSAMRIWRCWACLHRNSAMRTLTLELWWACLHIDTDCEIACTQESAGPEREADCEARFEYKWTFDQRLRRFRVPLAAFFHGLWNAVINRRRILNLTK